MSNHSVLRRFGLFPALALIAVVPNWACGSHAASACAGAPAAVATTAAAPTTATTIAQPSGFRAYKPPPGGGGGKPKPPKPTPPKPTPPKVTTAPVPKVTTAPVPKVTTAPAGGVPKVTTAPPGGVPKVTTAPAAGSSAGTNTKVAQAPRAQDPGVKASSSTASYKPPPATAKPTADQSKVLAKATPKTLTYSSKGYSSPVTHITYIAAPRQTYLTGGYIIDTYNPYNPVVVYALTSSYYYGNHPHYPSCAGTVYSDLGTPLTAADIADITAREVVLPDGSIYLEQPGQHLTAADFDANDQLLPTAG